MSDYLGQQLAMPGENAKPGTWIYHDSAANVTRTIIHDAQSLVAIRNSDAYSQNPEYWEWLLTRQGSRQVLDSIYFPVKLQSEAVFAAVDVRDFEPESPAARQVTDAMVPDTAKPVENKTNYLPILAAAAGVYLLTQG